MKAWLAKGVVGFGAGLGKKNVLVIPRENGNSLAVDFTEDGRVWLENEEMMEQPGPDDELEEVEISEELAREVEWSFCEGKGNLTQRAKNLLTEFIISIPEYRFWFPRRAASQRL